MPRPRATPKLRTTIDLPVDLAEWLEREAIRRDTTKVNIIRVALEALRGKIKAERD